MKRIYLFIIISIINSVIAYSVNTAPVISEIPDQLIMQCDSFVTISLDDYVEDLETPDSNITWQAEGNSELSVSIIDRVATISVPYNNWYGSENIIFVATDDSTISLSDRDTVIFTISQLLTPAITSVTQSSCEVDTGSIILGDLPSEGTWTVTIEPVGTEFEGSGSSTTITGITGGDYYFTVTNEYGCTSGQSEEVTINEIIIPEVDLGEDSTVCSGNTITLDAGYGYDSLKWSTGDEAQTIDVSSAGTYSVTVSNGECVASDSVQVYYEEPIEIDIGNDTTLCSGTIFTIDAGDYNSFLWSTGAETRTIDVSTGGAYSVTARGNACSATDTVMVYFDDPINVNLGNDTTLISGDTITLDAGADYDSLLWSTGAETQTIVVSSGGTYSVNVYKGACSTSDEVIVAYNESIAIDLGHDTTVCSGDMITLDAGAGYDSLKWSTGDEAQTIDVTTSGIYTVTVYQGVGSAYDEVTVSFDDPITVELGNDTTLCSGNTITLDAGTGYDSLIWSTGDKTQTIGVTSSDTYSVTVTKGACSDIDSMIVSFDDPITVELGNDTTLCSGSTIALDAGTGYDSLLWSTGEKNQTIEVVTGGTYSITVTSGACTAADEVEVSFDEAIELDLGNDLTACSGSNITLDAGTGNDSYLWSTGEDTQSITVSLAGTYSVTVTRGACNASDGIQVSYGDAINIDLGEAITACEGNTVSINAGTGYDSYTWSTGESTQSISVTTMGTYSVTVTSGECSASDELNVSFDEAISINLGEDIAECSGNTVTLSADPGHDSYLWSSGESIQSIDITSEGTYSVTVTSGMCTATDEIQVSFDAPITVDIGDNITGCSGNTVLLDAGSGYDSYKWNTNEETQSIEVATLGTYSVIVTNGECSATDETQVSFDEAITVNLGNDSTLCPGQSMLIDAGSGYDNYLWSTGEETQSIQVSTEGKYSVTVTNGECEANNNIYITYYQDIEVSLGEDINTCAGKTIILNAGPGYEGYVWSTGSSLQSINVTETGRYWVVVWYCYDTSSDTVAIIFNDIPEIDLGNDTTIENGQRYFVVAEKGFESYKWNTGEEDRIIEASNLVEGDNYFSVTVSDQNGCYNSDTIIVTVKEQVALEGIFTDRKIMIYPNPSYDMIYLKSDGDVLSDIFISIFDNTGKLMLSKDIGALKENQGIEINISDLKPGMYVLNIHNNDTIKVLRFLKGQI